MFSPLSPSLSPSCPPRLCTAHAQAERAVPYGWTQTLQDVNVTFPVPAATKGKDVTWEVKAGSIKLLLNGAPLLQAALPKRVKPDGCEWTLSGEGAARAIFVTLTKDNQMEWWPSVGEGEPAIDVSKVEPENSKLSDLDPETRKTVEKMMFDQAQKAKGLPTSDEMEKMAVFEKFKKQHPEMDFSQAKSASLP